MEFLYTYAVSVGITLYFGYALISGIDNAVDQGLRGWFRRSRTLLLGLACAVAAGVLGHVVFATPDRYERWSLVLGLAVVCGSLTTLVASLAASRLRGDDRD